MLLRFSASNHRSIMRPVELSMVAVDEDRPAARRFELLSERVLTVAGIYGPNASGKSNVLHSLIWLSAAVRSSLRRWGNHVPREPFKFGLWPENTSIFEVEMIVDGVRYSYRLEVDSESVHFESLCSYPERRRRLLFERTGMNLQLRRGLGSLSGVRELLTPTTLALSAALRFNEPEVWPFGQQLAHIANLGFCSRLERPGAHVSSLFTQSGYFTERMLQSGARKPQPALFDDESDRLGEAALALLKFADLGIDDIAVEERVDSGGEVRHRLRLLHRVAGQQLPFDLSEESEGTKTWFNLIGPVLDALQTGQTLLFDEIDGSLHPRLSARLLELFQDPEINPLGSQLLFTTHDTSLLNYLNRDEVWLTEKNAEGGTELTALAEYGGDKVRRSLNLEKAYLQGRFGAVPDLDQYVLRQALGMVRTTD